MSQHESDFLTAQYMKELVTKVGQAAPTNLTRAQAAFALSPERLSIIQCRIRQLLRCEERDPLTNWKNFYREVLNLRVRYSSPMVSNHPPGFDQLILVATQLSMDQFTKALTSLCETGTATICGTGTSAFSEAESVFRGQVYTRWTPMSQGGTLDPHQLHYRPLPPCWNKQLMTFNEFCLLFLYHLWSTGGVLCFGPRNRGLIAGSVIGPNQDYITVECSVTDHVFLTIMFEKYVHENLPVAGENPAVPSPALFEIA